MKIYFKKETMFAEHFYCPYLECDVIRGKLGVGWWYDVETKITNRRIVEQLEASYEELVLEREGE